MRRRAQAFVIGALTAGLLSCSDEQAPAQTPGAPAQPNAQPTPQQAQPRASARDSATLRAVRARNRVNCGVNHSLPGFAYRTTGASGAGSRWISAAPSPPP
jgi:hypothetical protein